MRPDHSAEGRYDRQAVGPIISLPPQAPGIMPGAVSTDNNIVADQPQRAASMQDADDVGPSDGRSERKVVLTQTHKRYIFFCCCFVYL